MADNLALQPIQHGEQIPVQSGILPLEDHVTVVDEYHGRRIAHRRLEDLMELRIEVRRSGNDGSIDQKELAAQSVRECSPDGRLSRPWRASQEHAALGLE